MQQKIADKGIAQNMERIDIIRKESTGSTNADMKRMLEQGMPEGTVIVAETQTNGRGRHDRVWHSPAGSNLYFSLLLRPAEASSPRIPQLAMLAATALHKTLKDIEPSLMLGLKWPNDVWLDNKKTSGILCENISGQNPGVIIGIGLNVNSGIDDFPPELQNIATSLAVSTGHEFDRMQILIGFLENFVADYNVWNNGDSNSIFAYWNDNDILKGRKIEISDRGNILHGIADGINDSGFLRLKLDNGSIRNIYAGDVHLTSID